MAGLLRFLDRLSADESGATMVEYTILIGLITIVSISLIAAVGNWVGRSWVALNDALAANLPAT
jgi:pilus assembly protein Flp/PilA